MVSSFPPAPLRWLIYCVATFCLGCFAADEPIQWLESTPAARARILEMARSSGESNLRLRLNEGGMAHARIGQNAGNRDTFQAIADVAFLRKLPILIGTNSNAYIEHIVVGVQGLRLDGFSLKIQDQQHKKSSKVHIWGVHATADGKLIVLLGDTPWLPDDQRINAKTRPILEPYGYIVLSPDEPSVQFQWVPKNREKSPTPAVHLDFHSLLDALQTQQPVQLHPAKILPDDFWPTRQPLGCGYDIAELNRASGPIPLGHRYSGRTIYP